MLARLPLEAFLGLNFPFILVFPALTLASVRAGAVGGLASAAISLAFVLITRGASLGLPSVAISTLLFLMSVGAIIVIAHVLRTAVSGLRAQEHAMRESDTRLRLLVLELQHRVNNSLALTGALVNLTARHCTDLSQFTEQFEPRLQSLARAQALLTQTDWAPVDLHELTLEALNPFLGVTAPTIRIQAGPAFVTPAHSAVSLSLVLTELATNAVKYGALSFAEGQVDLTWNVDPSGANAHLTWRESGGPPVQAPLKSGFGSELFVVVSRNSMIIDRRFEPQGVVCEIDLRATP